MKNQQFFLALAILLTLQGCVGAASSISSRYEKAKSTAAQGSMVERVVPSGKFNLTTFERITAPKVPVTIYIEGDGLAWLSTSRVSGNPTPNDPVMLKVAALDRSANVVYMARPCQYSGMTTGEACENKYWTVGRTAPEVIESFMGALDNIKALHQASGFHLVGYSGGASVAALVAAQRSDILSLRTLAGNMNYALFTSTHGVSPMDGSLDPITVAPRLAKLPQHHYIGADDTVVPSSLVESWKHASRDTSCIQSTLVPGVSHEKGWDERWPELMNQPTVCMTAPATPQL